MHLQTLAITINQSLIGKVRLLWTMLHHIPRPFGLGIFLWWTVQDAMEAHTNFPGLCCPKPRRALDILCRVVYTGSSKKTEEQGSAE